MASIKVLIFLLLVQALHIVQGQDEPKRETTNGTVIGTWQPSRNGRSFESFQGLRYAKPPGRFQRPEPPGNWTGDYDASNVGSICPQFDPINQKYYDNEDCLYLNIYVPKSNATGPLPVMFWIHGGAFEFGAGSDMGPDYFMDEDIVLVTINYRLGVFGFLNMGERVEASGNMGIRDMIQALRWTQDNVKFFGGDAKKITIFGESAGGASVHALVISPLSSGSIYRAIAQSGTMLTPWSFDKDTSRINTPYYESVGCKGENKTVILKCLKDKTTKDLIVKSDPSKTSFVPSWDPEATEPVFPKTPTELVEQGEHIKNINMVTGFNEKEALAMAVVVVSTNETMKYFNENWKSAISALLNLEKSLAPGVNLEQITSEMRDIYLDGKNLTSESLMNLTDLISDCFFVWGAKHAAVLHARQSAKVFPYVFTYKGNFSMVNLPDYPNHGPGHADELQYLFPSLLGPQPNWPDLVEGSDDEDFSKRFIALWKSFAQDGEPNDWDVAWKPIPQDSVYIYNPALQWYHIDETAEQKRESSEFQRRMEFWTRTFTSSAAFITSSTFYLLAICSTLGLYLH